MSRIEVLENILIVPLVIVGAPILLLLVVALLYLFTYLWPIVFLAFLIYALVYLKRHDNPKLRPGRVKLLNLPKPVSMILSDIAKALLGIVLVIFYLILMAVMPMGLSVLITLGLVGYGVGLGLSQKKGGHRP